MRVEAPLYNLGKLAQGGEREIRRQAKEEAVSSAIPTERGRGVKTCRPGTTATVGGGGGGLSVVFGRSGRYELAHQLSQANSYIEPAF